MGVAPTPTEKRGADLAWTRHGRELSKGPGLQRCRSASGFAVGDGVSGRVPAREALGFHEVPWPRVPQYPNESQVGCLLETEPRGERGGWTTDGVGKESLVALLKRLALRPVERLGRTGPSPTAGGVGTPPRREGPSRPERPASRGGAARQRLSSLLPSQGKVLQAIPGDAERLRKLEARRQIGH